MSEKNNKPVNDNISVDKSEYEALKAKAAERDEYYDKYLRSHAEFENAKKRIEKERSDLLKYANEGFILSFLPIADNLEMAEKHIKQAKDFNAVREGVDMIQAQILEFLKEIGVERIKALGQKFDPNLHDAIETEEANGKNDGLVTAELKPGYKINGRLLRPVSVRIAKKKE
jgi:molecular chaperone GrpE